MMIASLPIAEWVQMAATLILAISLGWPLGSYMALVYEGKRTFLSPLLLPVERACLWACGLDAAAEMDWTSYAKSTIIFSLISISALFLLLVFQPFPEIPFDVAFNIAASFSTGANWQPFSPELTLTASTQMLGLSVHSFFAAAVGMNILVALTRGITRHKACTIGNFWVDLVRGILYVFLPLCFMLSMFLVSQGVVQTFGESHTIMPRGAGDTQIITTGPVASQAAIKQIGTNGGGYYLANAAHPFENPTPLSNFIQLIAMIIVPIASVFYYGKMVKNIKQTFMILSVMLIFFIPMSLAISYTEQGGNPLLTSLGIDQQLGNMEGKELRFGTTGSTLWAATTTATSNGATNAALDSFMPLSGMFCLIFIQIGEILIGGVGAGLFVMLVYILLTVFLAGNMIGRAPEYLGKKIGVLEIQMASIVILIPTFIALVGTAFAVMSPDGQSAITNPGAQGFSQILFAFSSASNTNGASFAGLSCNNPFYNILISLSILIGRYGTVLAVLAIAGSMAKKNRAHFSYTSLNTNSPLFILLLCSVIIISFLTFLPSVALGPIAEHYNLWELANP